MLNFSSASRQVSEQIWHNAGGLTLKRLKVDRGVFFAGPTGGLKLLEQADHQIRLWSQTSQQWTML